MKKMSALLSLKFLSNLFISPLKKGLKFPFNQYIVKIYSEIE